jgi:predicted AAA+ superfamily ATPase
VIAAPKFYFADVGVVNHLAHRGRIEPGGELFGKAFENWVLHELTASLAYRESEETIRYWRLASGIEVDFIVGAMAVGLEAKATTRLTSEHLRGLRALHEDHPRARRILVCLEPKSRVTPDGIEIVPATTFAADPAEFWQTR